MKTNSPSFFGTALRAATLGLGLLAVAVPANAQFRDSWGRQTVVRESRHSDGFRHDRDFMRRYHAHPRSSFTLSFGSGYAGRGYYFGPPSAGYYYQRPGVVFYRSWDSVPYAYRRYSYAPRNGNAISVQQALARLGYYRGRIDGSIGPGTREAIMRFERRNGMPVTGVISDRLLRALNM
jgi:hypothetical protein